MNFSAKEKKVLKFVGLALILILYFNFYLRGQFKEVSKYKADINKYKIESQNNETMKIVVEAMDGEIKKLTETMEGVRTIYPPAYSHDELILILKKLEENANIRIVAFNINSQVAVAGGQTQDASTVATAGEGGVAITDTKLLELNKTLGFKLPVPESEIVPGEEGATKKKSIEIPDGKGFLEEIILTAKGSYSDLKKFIAGVEALKSKATIKKMDLSKNSDNSLNISMVLNFYGIKEQIARKVTSEIPAPTRAPADLFQVYEGYSADDKVAADSSTTNQDASSSEASALNADFTVRVLPFGNGQSPQTFTMTAKKVVSGDSVTSSAIYGDKASVENSELYLEEINGKYFFKMKSSTESYPDKQYSKTSEFKPVGDSLSLIIDSTIRKSANDKSGVKLAIINETKKTLNVIIINDDKTRPRVSISKTTSNIIVKK